MEEEEQEAVVLGGNGGGAAVPESQEGRRRVGHQACFSGGRLLVVRCQQHMLAGSWGPSLSALLT